MVAENASAPLQLTREQARRIAVRAQLLTQPRPTDLLEVLRHLAVVQVDLTEAVAPSADLVCWSRLGEGYRPSDLEALLDGGTVVELAGFLRPVADLALFRGRMAAWPGEGELRDCQAGLAGWLDVNEAGRLAVLQALQEDGPLPAAALPDECVVPWRSTGWTNTKNVVRLLDLLEARGEVAVVAREGKARVWDLADRVRPLDGDSLPLAEAEAERDRRRLVALGIARARSARVPGEPDHVRDLGVETVIEGVRGRWRVDPAQAARLEEPLAGRAALLSPIDRLVVDRKRMTELFVFDYQLEMYKPRAKRRWGYWAMPVLLGDRLVGKLDATSEVDAGRLRVDAVYLDVELTRTERDAVDDEIEALADFLGLRLTRA